MKEFETIVLGLGAMGSATVYQLAKRGSKVLGIEQFKVPHTLGSSHGDTRITRLAIGEGDEYVPLALRSHELWKEIESETGERLLTQNGGLIISSGNLTAINHVANFFENTIAAAVKYGIKHEILTTEEIRSRFPQFNVKDNETGYFEPEAGFLNPENCIRVQIELAKIHGADIHEEEKVISYKAEDGRVVVTTNKETYIADKLVITAGPWLPSLLAEKYSNIFKVIRQVLFWFDTGESYEQFHPNKCPIFIWELQGDHQGIYGFPAIGGKQGGVKIASEQYETTTTPEMVDRTVTQKEIDDMYEHFVLPYLPDLKPESVKTMACLYTVTSDSGFVIDKHPDIENVVIASPCSGHGFKHSAAIGETLAELALEGKTHLDISKFALDRFTNP